MSANYANGKSLNVDVEVNNDDDRGNDVNEDETGSQNHAQKLPLSQENISQR